MTNSQNSTRNSVPSNDADASSSKLAPEHAPEKPVDAASHARGLYLELLKRSLIGMVDEDPSIMGLRFGKYATSDYIPKVREWGKDAPSRAATMIGLRRMNNIQACIEQALADHVPGDCIETGVWRGGATIFMRGILAAYQVTDRAVWVADSFQGLPLPNLEKYPADKGWERLATQLAISQEEVRHNFARYGLLDDQVRFLPGWFKDTLPAAPIQSLALLRLDGDLYESTWDALSALYPKLSPGGFVIIDDYIFPSCRQAVLDYREQHGIVEDILPVDSDGVFWRRAG